MNRPTRTARTDKIHDQVKIWIEGHVDYLQSSKFDTDVTSSGMKTWSDWVSSSIGPNLTGIGALTADEITRVCDDTAALIAIHTA